MERTPAQLARYKRSKGADFERAVVNMAKKAGLEAERTAPMQGSGRLAGSDVLIAGRIKVECKHHARITGWKALHHAGRCPAGSFVELNAQQQAWLEDHDLLVLKQTDGGEPVAVEKSQDDYHAIAFSKWLLNFKEGRTNA